MKTKHLFIAATAILAFASCSSDDFVGDKSLQDANGTGGAISFTSGTPAITRASGSSAATSLNKNFVVFGFKGGSQTVFDNYQVNYVDATGSSAGSTESNSAGWEYVSYKNVPDGVTTNVGVTAFSALTGSAEANKNAIDQSIKYWDFSAGTYDFIAYSLGTGATTFATASAITTTGYSLSGSQAELATCYISKQKHIESLSTAAHEVDLEFVNFLSKIQLGFFETIPGYSVKDLVFYYDADNKTEGDITADGLKPALYGATDCIPTGGTYNITFDASYNPVVTITGTSSTASDVQFDAVSSGSPSSTWLSPYAAKQYEETEGTEFIGRTSSAATYTSLLPVLPNSTGTTLTLKMDYTLVSIDKTGETIKVEGATATVPAIYTAWKPNYAYTYIFKITDDKLVPITLDAIVTETENGSQTTITTVATPSITTYQNGAIANEYTSGTDIYVVVGDGTTELTTTNAKLYTATIETGAAQGIATDGSVALTEAMVENALANGATESTSKVVTDANGKKLTVTQSNALSILDANAEVGGITYVATKAAKFTPADNTVYVFEYIKAAVNDPFIAATGTYNSSMTYYTDASGKTPVNTEGFTSETSVTGYYVANPSYEPSTKHYKVIKVGTPTPVVP